MSKMKKIMLGIVIGIMALVGLSTTANATPIPFESLNELVGTGRTMNVTFASYDDDGDIYCTEHYQKLTGTQKYRVISKVSIHGTRSTDYLGNVQDSWHNAKLAYILSVENGSQKKKGPVTNNVWNYMKTWLDNVGQYHANLYANFSNGVRDEANFPATQWLDIESTEYANQLVSSTQITDNTRRENIQVVSYTKDGRAYMRVGPFNWSFGGTITGITLYDQNGQPINDTLYSSFNGNSEYWYGVDQVASGRDFYISVPVDTNITQITRITGYAKVNVKNVDIWFLEALDAAKQNLIIKLPSEGSEDIETPFDQDIPIQGSLKVIKVNAKNHAIRLPGVGFKVQNKDTGKYVRQEANGAISYVDNRNDATEFVTNQAGEILIEHLIVGTYVAYETKNPNYGYEVLSEGVEQKVTVDKTTEMTILNPQIYVKLSGFVWVDKPDGKGPHRNDLFKDTDTPNPETPGEYLPDTKDMLFDGVTVRLKDKTTGETVRNKSGQLMEMQTSQLNMYKDNGHDGHGEYLFVDVLIEKLKDYYVEFEYDGLTYTNVVPYTRENNGSKAAEGEARDVFNKNFSVVEGRTKNTGFTRDANGNEKHSLSYSIEENGRKQTAILDNQGQYKIVAQTEKTDYIIKDHFKDGDEEIRYINLGLYEREQPKVSLGNDLHNVKLEINGYGHTYLYGQRYTNATDKDINGFNVGVKYGNKYNEMSYSRAIYKSDYEYTNNVDKSKELKVYVTYELVMTNEKNNLISQVNSIADYYDSRYTLQKVGSVIDEKTGEINENSLISYNDSAYNENYRKVMIHNNTKIQPLNSSNSNANGSKPVNAEKVYIQFLLNRDAVINILNDKATLNNIAEINSYSVYDKNNKIYAGIDEASNPGNYVPGDKTREDDTDSSPALKLEVADVRQMTGKVFEDAVNEKNADQVMTGKVRQGNGQYDKNEKGIGGVAVTLVENKTDGSGKVYRTQTIATEANKYGFRQNEAGIIVPEPYDDAKASEYLYTYDNNVEKDAPLGVGDFFIESYIPGDYTLTYTWGDQTYTVQDYKGTIYDKNRDQSNLKWYKEVDTRLTDALDNYQTRLDIDAEIKKVNSNTKTTIDKMDSTTPLMGIGVEYDDNHSASMGDRFTYQIKNIDFGIVERAKQDLVLNKRVATFKASLANGQVIADLTIDEDGNITGDRTNVTYMKPDGTGDGFIKLEVDNELLQGTKVEVGYEIKAINQSEIDRLSKEFYHYGTPTGDIVTINPTAIIDYLDSDWSIDMEENTQWTLKSEEEIKDIVAAAEVIDGDESEIHNRTILYTEALKEHKLGPTDSVATTLKVFKEVTTTDEIALSNETEIVEIEKTGGRIPESAPGNYVPGAGETESDDSTSEEVIVTPATGENQNYILPILTGTIALIILGAGVVLIKKKAL